MIELQHLSKCYKSAKDNVMALHDVSFSLPSCGLVFLVGETKSGKTTLLNMLAGMDMPTEGNILLNGSSIFTKKEKDLDTYRNNVVGLIFQTFAFLENETVGSNLLLASQLKNKKASRKDVKNELHRLGFEDVQIWYDRKISQLSADEKQRVAIARAIIKNPQIILADEPASVFDGKARSELYEQLKELSKEKLVIVATQDREVAEHYADRIIEIKDATIIESLYLFCR